MLIEGIMFNANFSGPFSRLVSLKYMVMLAGGFYILANNFSCITF